MTKRETLEIPREAWAGYLDALSNREHDHPVRIRIEGTEVGDQVLADGMPLVGISLERKGSEANAIEVTLAHEDRQNLTHMIQTPEHVYVEEGDNGQVMVLDIEDTMKVKTLIFFDRYLELPEKT
jgi:Family of unknown function (DUF5335)